MITTEPIINFIAYYDNAKLEENHSSNQNSFHKINFSVLGFGLNTHDFLCCVPNFYSVHTEKKKKMSIWLRKHVHVL